MGGHRDAPVQALANSLSITVPTRGQVSPAIGLLLMVACTAAARMPGGVVSLSRDA
jgi:hypothetical protein